MFVCVDAQTVLQTHKLGMVRALNFKRIQVYTLWMNLCLYNAKWHLNES